MTNKSLSKLIYLKSSIFPITFLQKTVKEKIIFPFYHAISNNPPIHLKNLYSIKNVQQFKTDIDFLLKNYNVINFQDIQNHFRGIKKITKPSFFLSFDDGLSEIYNIVAPILKQKGLPAIFFINSDFVDNKDLFFRYKLSIIINKLISEKSQNLEIKNILKKRNLFNITILESLSSIQHSNKEILDPVAQLLNISFENYLKTKKPYLTSNQIIELQKQGFIIAAHSKSHPLYSSLTIEDQLNQTKECINFVQKKFPSKNNLFAFPFSDDGVKIDFFEQLFAETEIDFTFGTAGIKKDSFSKNIQRIPMENGKTAKQILKYEYFYYILKSFIRKNTIRR